MSLHSSALKSVPLWTAIITPMLTDGKIDFISFERLLEKQSRVGNGVILLGSTGESLALSRAEKETVLNFALGLKLAIPMIAGVPGHQLEEAIDWMAFARSAGIQGFLAVTPYYAKPGCEGQVRWFEKILDAAGLPVMLYNVPSRSGTRLDPAVLKRLAQHENLWALKESSGSLESLNEYQKANAKLAYYCGDDGLIAEFSKAGVKGLISVASNVWPEATRKIVELCLVGKFEDLAFWPEAADTLFLASNPIPAKWLHHRLGEISSPITRAPLDVNDFKDTEALVAADHRMQAWLKERSSL